MSFLSDKYNASEQTIKNLIKDGWISCDAAKHDEIITEYNRCISQGLSSAQAITNAADVGKISERWVYKILEKAR